MEETDLHKLTITLSKTGNIYINDHEGNVPIDTLIFMLETSKMMITTSWINQMSEAHTGEQGESEPSIIVPEETDETSQA